MPRSGINDALFRIVSSPPEWTKKLDEAEYSPYFLPNHKDLIELFLDATTDSVRLVRASKASREILDEFDMAELEDLRATVQASELLRVIPYPRQTDHSAHTLYLFLLGVYLFFACAPLRAGIAKFLNEPNDSARLVERFLFQWVFVSLLHDIGYIFQGRSKNEIRAVDRIFRAPTITSLMDSAPNSAKRAVRKDFLKIEIKPFEPIQNAEDMLSTLRHMPWGRSAGFSDDIFESFHNWGPKNQQITSNDLEDYAYRVASSGYDGFSEGTVDHAIASGLFLLRYSSLWQWLANENGFEDEPFVSYRDNYPSRDVACACFAAAAHNVIGVHAKEFDPLVFETNPILYLGIVCDELQKWDRFPAGERYIADLSSFEKYCTDSERITVSGDWDGNEVIFKFAEEDLATGIKEALKRLDSVERFIKINPTDGLSVATLAEQNSETGPTSLTDDSESKDLKRQDSTPYKNGKPS
jgi:hypothetical protein